MLSPDALMASCPAKNQTSGSIFPASTAAVEGEQKSRLFSGHESEVVSGGEQEAGTIYISSQTTAENKGMLHDLSETLLCDGCL